MNTEKLKPLGRCRKLREQRSANALGLERARYAEIGHAFQQAMAAFEDNRQGRRQRERQIYRAIRKTPVPVDHLETLRWELAAMELEIERLWRRVEDLRSELEAAAAEVERAREAYRREVLAVRKWDKVVARAAGGEDTLRNRLAEIEQDDANVEHMTRR